MLDDCPEIMFRSDDGNSRNVVLEIIPGEATGLQFSPPVPKRCGNNCIFCFIHQLPKGLRRPLYLKDEDYRLSFLHGTYITLTNIKPSELRRIIRQRLSPLYVSVHTTDPQLREMMLGKAGIPPVMEQLRQLSDAGIRMHSQVVLCPGINDGVHLERTVRELASLYPSVQSLAVVPLGLTTHRERLPRLTPVDAGYAACFLEKWLPEMRRLNRELGEQFLQIADEFFLKAGLSFPPLREYGDLPQWENGVGMVPCFLKEAASVLRKAKPVFPPVSVTVATGESAAGIAGDFLQKLSEKTGCSLNAVAIPNRLFGASVTVTGLVCGRDILETFKDVDAGDALLIPEVMLKEGEGLFLDDLSLDDLKARGICPLSFEATPEGLLKAVKLISRRKKTGG